ncbi:MAG: hypothetical protein MUC81_05520 [Bacteroidia bacterium]|jgi:DNA repair exonuclease SbcCD ATPase subunit|nr:hypothetical protein [Bacteroidia bacterium]
MENQKQNKTTQYALLVLLIISLVGNVFQYKNNQVDVNQRDLKIDTLVSVQAELEQELTATGKELENYRGIASNLDSLLNDANDKIALQEAKIKRLLVVEKDGKKLNAQLKKELAELRKLKEQYLEKIDQLISENEALKRENEAKAADITKLNEEKKGLQDKVATAEELKAEYIKVAAFKKRGNGKFVETSLAKRTNKIDVSLTVMDNKLAKPGDRMVYVVITEPGGKVLAGPSMAKFTKDGSGEELAASASYKLNYNGQKQEIKVAYESDERELTPGNYSIDVYINGTLVNTSTYILR